jgi:hypothetical protein
VTTTGSAATGGGEQTGRRQTPTERHHELALLVAGRPANTAEHGLALTRNSKGDVQIELTVRSSDLAELERDATAAFDRLCAKYPRGDAAAAGGTP